MHRPASIHRRFARLAAALLALVLLAGCADTVIHESDSPYGKLFVTESNDGLRTLLGSRNFPIIREHVDAIATVSEAGIVAAMRRLWETAKIVVEASGAVPLGVIQEHPELFSGRRVGVILSGGNVDLPRIPEFLERGSAVPGA